MVRKFNIEISEDYGWEIDSSGFTGPYDSYKSVDDVFIGVCKQKENKLVALYDPTMPSEELIKNCSENPLFQEECKFIHNKHTFEGTFIDALKYIQREFK